MLIYEILEKSLNFSEIFGGCLKGPWILKMILGIFEFCAQCNTSTSDAAFSQEFVLEFCRLNFMATL